MKHYRLTLLLSFLCAALVGCGGNAAQSATPPPIVILATPAPTSAAATGPDTAATSGTSTQKPAATAGAAKGAPKAIKGTITLAFDAFPSFYPALIMDVKGLLEQRGYKLKLVPLFLDDQNSFAAEERFARLKSGEWDVLASTLDEVARHADPDSGAITTVIDESAGADKLVARPEIATINDLRGKRVAFSEGSVSEYFLYYALSLAGLKPTDVTLVPQQSPVDTVQAYTSGKADAVVAWEPDVLEAEQEGAKVVIASDKLRAILDVLVTSRSALTQKAEGVQAFHDAWFEALKLMTDSPDEAEQAIIRWGNNDWSTIGKPGDLKPSLEKIAQATLNANQIAFRTPATLVTRLREAQAVWANAGQKPPEADLNQLVDGTFVIKTAQDQALLSTQAPVNKSFLLTAQIELPQLSESEQQRAQPIVTLPLEKIDFDADSLRLTDKAIKDLDTQILPALRSSTLYLKIDGSSAWPGPEGRFSAEEIRTFAQNRAASVATYLSQEGISPNRLIIGTIDPKYPNSLDDAELAEDRIVRFTLIAPKGR